MGRGILALLAALLAAACGAPGDGAPSAEAAVESKGSESLLSWLIEQRSQDGTSGGTLGRMSLTDPSGGPPRAPRVGSHGLRVVLETPEGAPRAGEIVRVIYRREEGVETRSITAVESTEEPGVYLGTVDLVTAGVWRFAFMVEATGFGRAEVDVAAR